MFKTQEKSRIKKWSKTKIRRSVGQKKNPKKIKVRKPAIVRKTTSINAAKKLRDRLTLLRNKRMRSNVAEQDLSRAQQISDRLHSIQATVRKITFVAA